MLILTNCHKILLKNLKNSMKQLRSNGVLINLQIFKCLHFIKLRRLNVIVLNFCNRFKDEFKGDL